MGHDPQRAAGAYLGGELGRQRERFEAHLLACEACWGEVQAARQGRALAESAREVAPQHLRERVRATIEATPAGRRRHVGGWAALAAVIMVAAVAVLLVARQQPAQPAPIAAAVASYQADSTPWSSPADPPRRQQLGELRWRGSGRDTLGGLPVVAHRYQDSAGHRIVLLQADQSFPTAVGTHHAAASHTWVTEVDGVVLFCADRPAPLLLVGQDRALVLLAASRLGLDIRGHASSP